MSKRQADEVVHPDIRMCSTFSSFRPHARHKKTFSLPSRAKQSFADECNINNIMAKFNKTGILEHENKQTPQYGDLMPFDDYHQALTQTIEAQEAFDDLPSAIRTKFNNDPGEFLQFVENPENADELVDLGLAEAQGEPSVPTTGATPGGPDQTAQGAAEPSPVPIQTGDSP